MIFLDFMLIVALRFFSSAESWDACDIHALQQSVVLLYPWKWLKGMQTYDAIKPLLKKLWSCMANTTLWLGAHIPAQSAAKTELELSWFLVTVVEITSISYNLLCLLRKQKLNFYCSWWLQTLRLSYLAWLRIWNRILFCRPNFSDF